MIRKVRIRRFRTVRDVTLDLGRLNVFIGANGSGKTSLLEALALLGTAARGRVDRANLRHGGARAKKKRQASSVEAWSDAASYRAVVYNPSSSNTVPWEFVAERMAEGEVEIASRDRRSGLLLLDRRSQEYVAVTPGPTEGLAPAVRGAHGRGPIAELLSELERFAVYSPSPRTMGGSADPTPSPPMGLDGAGLEAALASAARDRAFWDRFVAEVGGFRDLSIRGGGEPVTDPEAGEGARLVLFVFLLLLHPDAPPFLALRNPDSAMNPRLVLRVMERVRELVLNEPERPQLLLATQRPEVLDALDLRDERVRLFTVRRDRQGVTRVRLVEYRPEMAKLARRGMTLSQLWRDGWLGGMSSV